MRGGLRRLAGLLALPAALAAAGAGQAAGLGGQCSSAPALSGPGNYSALFAPAPPSGSLFEGGDLVTRTVSRRDHSVVDGSRRAWTTNAGWTNCRLSYAIHPTKGANFMMYLTDMAPGSEAAAKTPITERFMLVLQGQLEIEVNGEEVAVPADSYAYLPPASEEFLSQTVTSKGGAMMLVLDRIFAKAEGMPVFRSGKVADAAPGPSAAPGVTQRSLLPDSEEWDFDVVVVDVKPGASPPSVRSHYQNHGILLLAGEGILRLGDSWYPVRAGDAVWAAPYVPQWFAALGQEPARLVMYHDRNVDPLFLA